MEGHDDGLESSYESIAGAWVLDVARSDTMEGYLRCLGIPDAAIQAHVVGEQASVSRNVIALDENVLVLHKRTLVNDLTETFILGQEQVTATSRGDRRSIVCLTHAGHLGGFAVSSVLTTEEGIHEAMVVESRQLMPHGLAHAQEINLRNMINGEQHTTRRVWVRVPPTALDSEQLLAE